MAKTDYLKLYHHFLFKCTFFDNERLRLIKPYYRNRPNTCKMSELMNHQDKSVLRNLTSFVDIIMKNVTNTDQG